MSSAAKHTLEYIDCLKDQTVHRLDYAKRLVLRRSRSVLIQDCRLYPTCNFAGYLLVTVIDRGTEAAVYIQDADDWLLELVVSSESKAQKVFDDLFHNAPAFTEAFAIKLRNYGFHN